MTPGTERLTVIPIAAGSPVDRAKTIAAARWVAAETGQGVAVVSETVEEGWDIVRDRRSEPWIDHGRRDAYEVFASAASAIALSISSSVRARASAS